MPSTETLRSSDSMLAADRKLFSVSAKAENSSTVIRNTMRSWLSRLMRLLLFIDSPRRLPPGGKIPRASHFFRWEGKASSGSYHLKL